MNYKDYIKSNNWKKLRLVAYRRANHKCEFCAKKAAAVHHVNYPKNYSEDSLDNLVVVCEECHKLVHGIRGCTVRDILIFCLKNGILIDKESLEAFQRAKISKEKMIKVVTVLKDEIKPNKIITLQSIKLLANDR